MSQFMGLVRSVSSHYVAMFYNQIGKYFSRGRNSASSPLLDEDNSPLCEICSTLDLDGFLREGLLKSDNRPVILGALTTILSKKDTCGLCHLISLVFFRGWLLDLPQDKDLTSVEVELRVEPCGWADTTQFNTPFERKTSAAHRIRLCCNTPFVIRQRRRKLKINYLLELQMLEDDAVRFGRKDAFHGRRVGTEVNINMIRKWMQTCEKEHGPDCADVWKDVIEQLPQDMKIIDVVNMAIVEAPQNCRYMALSYMWGNVSTEYVTLSKNVVERCKKDSLKNVELPRTIRDAIRLVQELEERYLWVDTLCIIQDDAIHKGTQIAGMYVIYGAAVLTILSAGGISAQAPLPGLDPGSRQKLQQIKRIQSLQLTLPLRLLHETLAMSKWNVRGWTFQEHMLSRRRLFFTNEQVFFECERDEFCEDVIAESCKESGGYPAKNQSGILRLHMLKPSRYNFLRYRRYAENFMMVIAAYSIRELTYDNDIYNAVFGLISVFSRGFEMSSLDPNKAFLFGMPLSVLEDAMLWQPAVDAVHGHRLVEGLVTPSWSWAGCMGGVVYDDEEMFIHGPGYPGSEEGSLVDEWVIGDQNGQARRLSRVRPLQAPTYDQVPVKYIGLPSPPFVSLVEEGDSLAPGTLLFCTTAAFLMVRKIAISEEVKDYPSKFHSIFEILLDVSPPAMMGRIILPSNTNVAEPIEFVVLSRGILSKPDLFDHQVFGKRYVGCMLDVMAVKRVGRTVNGMEVFERVGVGLIVEGAWIGTNFKEQVVCLQ